MTKETKPTVEQALAEIKTRQPVMQTGSTAWVTKLSVSPGSSRNRAKRSTRRLPPSKIA